jgi:guanylate cyclase
VRQRVERIARLGPPGAIQVTERAASLLADRYELERRDDVEIKGKAPMTTYLLLGRRAAPPEPASLAEGLS